MSTDPASRDYNDAYMRIPGYASHLDRIQDARVMVIGIGALGNEVVKNLALFNVGHLFLCDFDTVESVNLSHSVLFRPGDEGRKKVEVARDRLRELNPAVQVTTFDRPLSDIGLGVWQDMDAVVCCVDNRGSRLLIDQYCGRVGKDWIDAGLSGMIHQNGPYAMAGLLKAAIQKFSPRRGIRYENSLQNAAVRAHAQKQARMSKEANPNWLHCHDVRIRVEGAGRIPTTPAMASLAGALQTQEVIRMLAPEIWGNGGIEDRCLIVRTDIFEFQLIHQLVGQPVLPLDPIVRDPALSAQTTTLREMVTRVRQDLGETACVELGFQYCRALRCRRCGYEDLNPFRLGMRSERCPVCSVDDAVLLMEPMDEGYFPDTLGGTGDPLPATEADSFWDTTLEKLGVPLFDVLTASVYSYETGRDVLTAQIHYALEGDSEKALGWIPR